MAEVTEETIGKVIVGMHDAFEKELLAKTEAELEAYWHFVYDRNAPLVTNLYQFYDMLKLYHGFCRRWEEATNGSCCVVERVRDKYLKPKIKIFAGQVAESLRTGRLK